MNNENNQWPLWEVFIQTKIGLPHKHVGSVHASDKQLALENARDVYTRRGEGRSIWVVPAAEIVATSLDSEEEFFDPANDKIYRHPTFYTMPEGAKHI